MSKLVFSSGDYEGRLISDVVVSDPAYVIYSFENNPELGITEHDYDEARRIVEEWDGNTNSVEDSEFAESLARESGWEPSYD